MVGDHQTQTSLELFHICKFGLTNIFSYEHRPTPSEQKDILHNLILVLWVKEVKLPNCNRNRKIEHKTAFFQSILII